jgi:hypothetical protein
MYAVEFQATIENGIVHIPKEYKDLQEKYKDLQEKREVRFFIMYDDSDKYRTDVSTQKHTQK